MAQTLTTETATAYVCAIISDWGADWASAEIGAARMDREDDADVVIVPTSMGDWTVWMEPDGALYGEV